MSQIFIQNHGPFSLQNEDYFSIDNCYQGDIKYEEEDSFQYLCYNNELQNQPQTETIYEPEYFLNFDEEKQNKIELSNKEEFSYIKNYYNEFQKQQNMNHLYFQTNQLQQQFTKEGEQYLYYQFQQPYTNIANQQVKSIKIQNTINMQQMTQQPLPEFEEPCSETNSQKNEQINSQSSIVYNYSKEGSQQIEKNISLIESEKNTVNQCDSIDINSSEQVESNDLTDQLMNKKQRNQNHFKNIFNAFKKHMKSMKKCDILDLTQYELSNLKKQLMRYMKLHTFNHTLLKYIINHKQYKLLLQDFLQKEGENWINTSKVQDKEEVLKKTSYLILCIKDPSLLDNLNTYQTNKLRKDQF